MIGRAISLRLDWLAIGVLGAADILLLLITNFTLVLWPELFVLAAAGFLQMLAVIYSTLRDAPRLANIAAIGSLLVLFTNVVAVLNYMLNGIFVLPLWDANFNAADVALGLNWLDFYNWISAHPGLFSVNAIIYSVLGPEVIFILLWLETSARHLEAVAFWRLFASTAFITVVLGVLVPAAGPFVFYHLAVAAHTGYVPQMAHLRSGTLRRIDLGHTEGLVIFPSFHTALALLCAYAARNLRRIAVPLLVLNLAIIFSAPVIGGHYFVDIIAGATLAILVITLPRRLIFQHR